MSERDLGIHITNDLKWKTQAQHASNRANAVLGSLKRTFTIWNIQTTLILYTSFVRPHLEYAVSAWNPYQKQSIKILERVQRRATKLIPSIRNLSYETRLKILGLTTLKERRKRGDLIQYYKISKGYNNVDWYHPNALTNSLNQSGPASNIRGMKHRLKRQITNCPSRENFFINRIVSFWNELPFDIVNAASINLFKNKYDEFIKK